MGRCLKVVMGERQGALSTAETDAVTSPDQLRRRTVVAGLAATAQETRLRHG